MDQKEINRAEWANPENWSVGLYFSKKDRRTWVPKSIPWMGWTLNLGTRAGAMWMIGLLMGLPLIVALLMVPFNGIKFRMFMQQQMSAANDDALSGIEVGMSETEVGQMLEPHVKDRGTVYWGGTGAKRVYFQIGDAQQAWVEFGAGPSFKVTAVGKLEPKVKWTRLDGDSITVGP